MPTYGEQLIESLLKPLPPREYFWKAQPTITGVHYSNHLNPDFIVVGAFTGVIVLEVKDYRKIIRLTQDEIEIEQQNGQRLVQPNPVRIAREYTLNLVDKFKQRSDLLHQDGRYSGKLQFPWKYAVALPHIEDSLIERAVKTGIWDEGVVLGRDALTQTNFVQALLKISGGFKLKQPLNNNVLNIIRGVIDPILIVEDSSGHDVGTITRTQEYEITRQIMQSRKLKQLSFAAYGLPQEASDLVDDISVRLVRGVAGSGKTLVLAHRARFLAQAYPDYSILVMTFNVDLADDLRKRIGDISSIEVTNFHKMCSRILAGQWRAPTDAKKWILDHASDLVQHVELSGDLMASAEFIADEIAYRKDLGIYDAQEYLKADRAGRGQALNRTKRILINRIFEEYLKYQHENDLVDWEDVPVKALHVLESGRSGLRDLYDVILIDEAQDFAPMWMQVVKELLKPNGDLFMCDDPSQSIFRLTTWKQKGIDVSGRTRILRVPFRATRTISEAAHSLLDNDTVIGQTEESAEPDFDGYELPIGEKPLLVNCLSQQNEVSFVAQKVEELIKRNVSPQQIAILCHSKKLTENWSGLQKQGVYVASFMKMKGLEFETVFMPHLQGVFERFGAQLDESTASEIKRKIFTAMTRARHQLVMTYCGQLPSQLAVMEMYVQSETLVS